MRDFLAGKLEDIAPYNLPQEVDKSGFNRVFAYGTISIAAIFNPSSPPLADVRVRKALAMAVDFDDILKDVGGAGSQWTRSHSFIPRGRIGYDQGYMGLPYDPRAARKLLRQAGYPDPRRLPTIRLFHTGLSPLSSSQIVNGMRRYYQALGIPFEVKMVSYAESKDILSGGRWQMGLAGYDTLYPDSFFLMRAFHSKSQSEWLKRVDARIDKMIEKVEGEADSSTRVRLFRELDTYVVGQAHLIPIVSGDVFDGYFQPWVESIQYPPTGYHHMELFSTYFDAGKAVGRHNLGTEDFCADK